MNRFILLLTIILITISGCNPVSVSDNNQPIEVESAIGPLEPINPGGPIVEITLKNVSDEPVVSLTATLEQFRLFEFIFDVTTSNPLLPGDSISSKKTLITGAIGDNSWDNLTINATLQNGKIFTYSKQIQFTEPFSGSIPQLLSPEQGAVLANSTGSPNSAVWYFDWADVEGATQYHIYIDYPSVSNPAVDTNNIIESSFRFAFVGTLKYHYGWIWKVRALVDGVWSDWSEARTFDVEFVSNN